MWRIPPVVVVAVAALLAFAAASNVIGNLASGMTWSGCVIDDDCRGDRRCYSEKNKQPCDKEAASNCVCVPDGFQSCKSDSECSRGERCRRGILYAGTCLSYEISSGESVTTSAADSILANRDCGLTDADDRPTGQVETDGGTYSPCLSNTDCKSGRQCLSSRLGTCCRAKRDTPDLCACMPAFVQGCSSDSDCTEDGEVCVGTVTDPAFCMSSQARDSLDADRELSSSVCVDAELLRHLPPRQLVYGARRVMASVLCDAAGSCATPGHVVVFNGEPMMMRSYCENPKAGCVRRRIAVNSPRYRRKLVVDTHTDGLHFTALAARYATRAEERVLAAAVRLGL